MVDSRRTGFAQGGRTFFSSEAEAIATAEQIARIRENEGAAGFAELSPSERRDASEALAILSGFDATLVDCARHFTGWLISERERAAGPSVSDALDAYLIFKKSEWQRGEISKLTFQDLVSKANPARDYFGDKRLSEIDRSAIEAFLAQLDLRPRGKLNVKLKLGQFLNWSVREKLISSNPANAIKVKVPGKDVEILSPVEAEAILRTADAKMLPYLVLGMFAGLRPFEAQQILWSDIDFENQQITVRKEITKVRETRYVTILPTLEAWLLPVAKKTGRIFAGSRVNARWPKNALRHSFASYHLATNQNRSALAEELGNSIRIIRSNYRKAVSAKVAEQYWKIRPPTGNVIDFPAETRAA
jgi:integrase